MKTQITIATLVAAAVFAFSAQADDKKNNVYNMPTDAPVQTSADAKDADAMKADGSNPYKTSAFMARHMASASDPVVPVVNAALAAARSNSWGKVVVMGDGAGMVVLSGLVTTRQQAMKALMIAMETPGVKGVLNDIQVKQDH